MGQADRSPCQWSSPVEKNRIWFRGNNEKKKSHKDVMMDRIERKSLQSRESKCQTTQKTNSLPWKSLAGQKKKLTALKRIKCSEGAACSNGEDSKELGGKCALGYLRVGHEAEIALCIHYARCKSGRSGALLGQDTQHVFNFLQKHYTIRTKAMAGCKHSWHSCNANQSFGATHPLH